jgi:hypothetical protein
MSCTDSVTSLISEEKNVYLYFPSINIFYSFVFVNLFFRHGGIIGYELSTNQKKFEYDFNKCNDTQAVAVYNDILVAGFRDGSVKVIY